MLCSCKNWFPCPSLSLLSDVIRVKIQLMTKQGAAHIAYIIPLLALVFGFPSSSNAQTVPAASCSQTDVQTAVKSAGRGGTVTVPAGSCSWSSTLTLTYGITLSGAGIGNTTITLGSAIGISGQPDAAAIANGETIKIIGFTFDGSNTRDTFIELVGASGITGTKPYCCYVIGNNRFQNGTTGSSQGVIQSQANNDGQLRGVIYGNVFDRCNIILRGFSNNDTREWANAAFNQLAFGTSDNLYFESNTIQFSSSYGGGNPGWIEMGQGGRIAIRYNTWNLANATTPQEVSDIHGFQNWNGGVNSGQTSTMIEENYGNTLSNMGTYRWMDHRGSWGLFFDNLLTGSGGNSIDLYGMSTPGSCPSDINPTPTNYTPVVNNTYFFNNTKNGTNVTAGMVSSGNPTHCSVTENSNWWNFNSSCTSSSCSAGIGTGTSAPTGACTTGVGYWVASTPTATTSSSIIQSGAFYKCTSTNTWTLYYRPYTYPHPLRSGSQTTGPAAPTGLTAVVQ
jgi:hypothetical protein